MKYPEIIKGIGKALCIVGGIWALPSMIPVGAAAYVLLHADGYAPADFVVSEVVFSRGTGEEASITFHARGTINSVKEWLPLHEFAGIGSGWLSVFADGARYPRTMDEAERYVKTGQVIRVRYNAKAVAMGVGWENLRVFVRREPFPQVYKDRLLRRDLPVCFGPLLAGVALVWVARLSMRKQNRIRCEPTAAAAASRGP